MRSRPRWRTAPLVACIVVIGACRSNATDPAADDSLPSITTGATESSAESRDTIAESSEDSTEPTVSDTTAAPTPSPDIAQTLATLPESSLQLFDDARPEDPEEIVLSDDFAEVDAGWSDDGSWQVELPGEAGATVIDGVGVMQTDARGTHEWVRAVAPDSTHRNAELFARITPITVSEGTVFVALHGDGEWRADTPYLPQSGVVVEYSYNETLGGEIVLIVMNGDDDELRTERVAAPVLVEGESALLRFQVVDGLARAKVWRAAEDEPAAWALSVAGIASDGGVVQVAYRDAVAQSVGWDELTLEIWS